MKINSLKPFFVLLTVSSLLFTGCGDDDTPDPVNPEELITTVILTFTPTGGGAAITATWTDIDGPDGPGAPDLSQANATLSPNTAYSLAVRFLNESENPVEEVTTEITNEDEDHVLYFSVTNGLLVAFTYADDDAPDDAGDGIFALGLATNLTTGDGTTSTGNLNVTLLHESDKSVGNIVNGSNVISTPANAGGETDVTADFTINVQ